MAFSKLFLLSTSLGFGIPCAASLPVSSATRRRWLPLAGGHADPSGAIPSASVMHAIVDAVPITPHVPAEGTSSFPTAAISSRSISPARYRAQYPRQSVHAPTRVPLWLPVTMGPTTSWMAGTSAEIAPISWAGTVLSHPPMRMTASIGAARTISSVSIAMRLLV
jgi:hypothetical protein